MHTNRLTDLFLDFSSYFSKTTGAGGQTIIFTNTKAECDNLITSNCFGQLKTQVLHGDIGQNSRQVTIKQFKEVII